MRGRRLILTADDLGASKAVNAAVLLAAREGALTHASLMAAGEAAQEAAALCRETPNLSVGLHAVLCAGAPCHPGSIQDGLAPEGRLPETPARIGVLCALRPRLLPVVERELRAQFTRFLSFGLAPSHVDAHAHAHMHPFLLPMLARLAREYGFTRIRLPGGEEAGLCRGYPGGGTASQAAHAAVFALLRKVLAPSCAGLEVPDQVFGALRSGRMDEGYLLHLIGHLPEGTTEIYLHPTADPACVPLNGRPTPTHRSYAELQALLSPRVRAAVEDIKLQK
ncbi:MAG: ChbG/HpnK family deacetylase [Elusimicrobiota bacterium]|jgi:hopanoid biosynthesis associated protein HpnK